MKLDVSTDWTDNVRLNQFEMPWNGKLCPVLERRDAGVLREVGGFSCEFWCAPSDDDKRVSRVESASLVIRRGVEQEFAVSFAKAEGDHRFAVDPALGEHDGNFGEAPALQFLRQAVGCYGIHFVGLLRKMEQAAVDF